MDLEKLRIFYGVAKAGSFSKASKVLHISQSALSRSVQLLEYREQVSLFKRTSKGLTLTEKGERLYNFAHSFIHEAERIIHSLRNNNAYGELKIVTSPHVGASWLMSYLREYLDLHSEVRITIIGVTEKINVVDADVAICTKVPHHPNLIQRYLTSFHIGLWASPCYLERHGIPKTLDSLKDHQMLAYGDDILSPYGHLSWVLDLGTMPHLIDRPYLKINSLEGLVNAAKEGLGIAQISGELPSIKNSDLVNVLPELNRPIVDLYYIYKENMSDLKRITSLADFLEHKMGKEQISS
jgi:DNA-binding transcriptional LysR family regulator